MSKLTKNEKIELSRKHSLYREYYIDHYLKMIDNELCTSEAFTEEGDNLLGISVLLFIDNRRFALNTKYAEIRHISFIRNNPFIDSLLSIPNVVDIRLTSSNNLFLIFEKNTINKIFESEKFKNLEKSNEGINKFQL